MLSRFGFDTSKSRLTIAGHSNRSLFSGNSFISHIASQIIQVPDPEHHPQGILDWYKLIFVDNTLIGCAILTSVSLIIIALLMTVAFASHKEGTGLFDLT